jgi:hypothetical protein
MPSTWLAALAASASTPLVPKKEGSLRKKKSSGLALIFSPFAVSGSPPRPPPPPPPYSSSTLPGRFSSPAAAIQFTPPSATPRSSSGRRSLKSVKSSKSNRSLSSVFRDVVAASASVPAVPPLPPKHSRILPPGSPLRHSSTRDDTNGRPRLNKSSSLNFVSQPKSVPSGGTAVKRCVVS